jgi:pSer/pThr/pTyr-binding forkhead associated (FHA) protein
VGKSHIVSRKVGDIVLADDQSVSRQHAVITVEHNVKDLVRNYKAETFCTKYIFSISIIGSG